MALYSCHHRQTPTPPLAVPRFSSNTSEYLTESETDVSNPSHYERDYPRVIKSNTRNRNNNHNDNIDGSSGKNDSGNDDVSTSNGGSSGSDSEDGVDIEGESILIPRILSVAVQKKEGQPLGLTLSNSDKHGSGGGGVVVTAISEGSPFHRLNFNTKDNTHNMETIHEGDEILTINNHRVKDPRRAANMIRKCPEGELCVVVSTTRPIPSVGGSDSSLTAWGRERGERRMEGTVYHMIRLPSTPSNSAGAATSLASSNVGIEFEESEESFVKIKTISNPSFAKSGLKVGDVVLSIDGAVVKSVDDAMRVLVGGTDGSFTGASDENNSRVVALLVYSFWDMRNQVIHEELLGSSPNNWEVTATCPGEEQQQTKETIALRMSGTTITFELVFDADGTCSCPEPLGALKSFHQHQTSQQQDSAMGEEPSLNSKQHHSTLSQSEARSALDLLYHRHIPCLIDALNYHTWKQVRLLLRALRAVRAEEEAIGTYEEEELVSLQASVTPPAPQANTMTDQVCGNPASSSSEDLPMPKSTRQHSCHIIDLPTQDTTPDNIQLAPPQEQEAFNKHSSMPDVQRRPVLPRGLQRKRRPTVNGLDLKRRSSFIVSADNVHGSRRQSGKSFVSALSESDSDDDHDSSSDESSDSSDSSSSGSEDESSRRVKGKDKVALPSSTQLVLYDPQTSQVGQQPTNTRKKILHRQASLSRSLKVRNGNIQFRYKVSPKIIGSGSFGTVRPCMHRKTKERLAVKTISKKATFAKNKTLLKNEITLLQQIDHKNIVRVADVIQDEERIHIVMEECKGGDLFDRVIEDGVTFGERRAAEIIGSLLDAVAYLHDMNIVHRDLKVSR